MIALANKYIEKENVDGPLFHACPHSVQVMTPFAVRLP